MFSTRHHRGPLRSVLVSLLAVGMMGGTVISPRIASAEPIDDKRRQAANIADQLENLAEQMDALGEDYAQSLTDQADLAVEIDRAQADVAAAEAQLSQMRGTLYMSAVTQFMHGGRNSTLTNLFASSGGVQDALQRSQLLSIAMNQGSLTTDSLDATATSLTKKKAALEKKRKQAISIGAVANKRLGAAEALAARYEELQSTVQGDLVDLLRELRCCHHHQRQSQSRPICQRPEQLLRPALHSHRGGEKWQNAGCWKIFASRRQIGKWQTALSCPALVGPGCPIARRCHFVAPNLGRGKRWFRVGGAGWLLHQSGPPA